MKKLVMRLKKKASHAARKPVSKSARAQARPKKVVARAVAHKRRTPVVTAAKGTAAKARTRQPRAILKKAAPVVKAKATPVRTVVAIASKKAPVQKQKAIVQKLGSAPGAASPAAPKEARRVVAAPSTGISPTPLLLTPRPIRPVFPENPVTLSWQAAVAKTLRGAAGNAKSLERRLRRVLESGLAARGVVVLKDALTRQNRAELIAATGPADATMVEVKFRGAQRGVEPNGQEFFETLARLEALVAFGYPQRAVLLVATNDLRYVQPAEGRQPPFATAMGRVYMPGTKLTPARLPKQEKAVPFVLRGRYDFNWERVGTTGWWVLVLWTAPSMWAQAQAARKQAAP